MITLQLKCFNCNNNNRDCLHQTLKRASAYTATDDAASLVEFEGTVGRLHWRGCEYGLWWRFYWCSNLLFNGHFCWNGSSQPSVCRSCQSFCFCSPILIDCYTSHCKFQTARKIDVIRNATLNNQRKCVMSRTGQRIVLVKIMSRWTWPKPRHRESWGEQSR